MLTGRRPFEAGDAAETLAFVMAREPNWDVLPADVPAVIQTLLRRCLEKDRRKRIGDIAAALFVIDEIASVAKTPSTSEVSATGPTVGWLVATGLAVATAAMAVPAVRYFRTAPLPAPPEMRVEITTPFTPAPLEFALSPDGRYIVFVASGNGAQRLWLRALDKTDAQPIAGTDGANNPFWSADSRSVAFTASGKLQRVDISGGSPQVLASTSVSRGGCWNADGTILFSLTAGGPLVRVAASGGDPVPVTRLVQGQASHRHPQFLPDGRHFLYWAVGSPEASGLYLGSLDGGESKRLAAADSAGAYLAPGLIAFVRGTTLMAQRLDLTRGELTGDPVRVADPVGTDAIGYGGFSITADGRLAYRGGESHRELRWYDRTGKSVGVAGEPESGNLLYPELSPGGLQVGLVRVVQGNFDVWLRDLVRGGLTRFTFDPSVDSAPVWSPDGARVAFLSSRKGPNNLYVKPSSGAGTEELLLDTPKSKAPLDWSRDGRFLLYFEADPKTGRDLWALPMAGNDRKPIPIVTTPFEELNGQFSPDGRWVAYESNESGRFEIVVQPFPTTTGKWQVSTSGGIQPRWRADGKELYFISPDGKLMAASVTAGATFAASTPVALFPVNVAAGAGTNKQEYAVSRDGRFLINQPVAESSTTPITLILNWKPQP